MSSELGLLIGHLATALEGAPDAGALAVLGDPPRNLPVEHERVFGYEVRPVASVFLSPDASLGGSVASLAARVRVACGAEKVVGEPDDAGALLRLLAEVADDPAWAVPVIDRLMTPWWPALHVAVVQARSPWFASATGLALDAVIGLRATFPAPREVVEPSVVQSERLDGLLVPAAAGGWLLPSAIRRIATSCGLPCGLGTRRDLLRAVLDGAAGAALLDTVEAELVSELDAWDAVLSNGCGPVEPWRRRIAATRRKLVDEGALAACRR